MKKLLLRSLIFTLVSAISAAQSGENFTLSITQPVLRGDFSNGIGSGINFNDQPGILLGQLLNHDFSDHSLMVYSASDNLVRFIPQDRITKSADHFQSVLKLYPQEGGTCTGYALDDYLLQLQMSGFQGNGNLKKDTSSEEGRTELLADTINQYYLVAQHHNSIVGILNSYGKNYAFRCIKQIFDDAGTAKEFLVSSLANGRPTLVSFNVGNTMAKDPFQIQRLDKPDLKLEGGLWLPRKSGQRMSGGHSIVAAGSFIVNSKTYLVMLDSDWDYPRVWDLDEAIGPKTAMPELEFYQCE